MFPRSDPCATFANCGTWCALEARPHDSPGDRAFAPGHQVAQASARTPFGKMEAAGLFNRWLGVWNFRSLFSELVVASLRQCVRYSLAAFIVGAISATAPRDATGADIVDVTLRTGGQVKDHFSAATSDRNFRIALDYFEKNNLRPELDGLVEIKFRQSYEIGFYNLLLAPFRPNLPTFKDSDTDQKEKYLIVYAERPQERAGSPGRPGIADTPDLQPKVLLGTISTETKPPEVKQENIVADGKLQAGKGHLKSWFRCSAIGCVPAGLGCLYGGPNWLPCFCLWCGGSVVACGINELFQ
jgi:hypothetical protein